MIDQSIEQSPAPRAALPISVWLAVVAALVFAALVISQRVPLWVPGQMTWNFRQPVAWSVVVPVVLLALAQWGVISRLRAATLRGQKAREAGWVIGLCVLALALNLALRAGESSGLARLGLLTVNPAAGGYYYAAFDSQNQSDWLADYPQLMREHQHVATHPPGGVWLMRSLRRRAPASALMEPVTEETLMWSPGTRTAEIATFARRIWQRPYQSSDIIAAWWAGLIVVMAAALVPGAVYLQTRLLFGVSQAACAAALAVWVPSFLLFSPALDTLTTLLATLVWVGCAWGLRHNKIAAFWVAGLIAGIGLLFSFALVPVLLMAAIFVVWRGTQSGQTPRHLALCGLAIAMGTLLVVAISAWAGVPWAHIYAVTRELQAETMLQTGRQYWTWMGFNLVDFFSFCGLPVLVMLLSVVRGQTAHETPDHWRALWPLVTGTLAVVIAVDFSANVLGETARVWMPFMPPLIVAAGAALARMEQRSKWAFLLVMGAQIIQLTAMAASLSVWAF